MTKLPIIITETNLSMLWAKAFLALMQHPKCSLMPMTLTLQSFQDGVPHEVASIRGAVDRYLSERNRVRQNGTTKSYIYSVEKTASTIFPDKLWRLNKKPNIQEFSKLYLTEIYPRLVELDTRNKGGTYFQRMVGFGATTTPDGDDLKRTINQLQNVATSWNKGVKRFASMQVSIHDPRRDHPKDSSKSLKARGDFPCLQQVGFSSDGEGGIGVIAFYPSEYILERGYGNYLGLCQLGNFMATQIESRLTSMTCFIGHPQLTQNKSELQDFAQNIKNQLNIEESAREQQGFNSLAHNNDKHN